MRILVTGGTGFVGRHLLPALSREHAICMVVRNKNRAKALLSETCTCVSLRSPRFKDQIENFNPEVVLHLASHLTSGHSTADLDRLLEANIVFGARLLDALCACRLRYFVNIGSFSEYAHGGGTPDPAYLYAATKLAFRQLLGFYAKLQAFQVVHVVPYTIYGPCDTRKKILDLIVDATRAREPLAMTAGEQTLDFIHIDDVVRFFVLLFRAMDEGTVLCNEYHLGTGIGTSLRELANLIEQLAGCKPQIAWGALPYRPHDILRAVAPPTTADDIIAWRPTVSLREGIQMLLGENQ